MAPPFALFRTQPAPLLAVAVHNGHALRPEVADWIALDEETRLREEDPGTGRWATIADSFVVANYSRFEVDLNRPPELAVYATPDEAWGLTVWKGDLPDHIVRRSHDQHAAFYEDLAAVLDRSVRRYGHVVVLDLHSYNYRRAGPDCPPERQSGNPDINIGTGTMDRTCWGPIIDRFIDDLRRFDVAGRTLDVRENVRFQGGYLPRSVHEHFPGTVCAIAVEVKKFFMDEWTGELDEECFSSVRNALRSTIPGLHESLENRGRGLVNCA